MKLRGAPHGRGGFHGTAGNRRRRRNMGRLVPKLETKPVVAKPTVIRGLVMKQPWAHAVFHLGKDLENRVRPLKYRGPLAIIAAKARDPGYLDEARGFMRSIGVDCSRSGLDYGGLVGAVEFYDVADPSSYPTTRWHMLGQYGYRIRSATSLPLRPLKGHQGLMRVELTGEESAALEQGGVLKVVECSLCRTRTYAHEWMPRYDGWDCCPYCEGV